MSDQTIFPIIPAVFAVCLIILSAGNPVCADTQQTKGIDSYYKALSERVEKGIRDYCKLLGLNREPFSMAPEPDFFYQSKQKL